MNVPWVTRLTFAPMKKGHSPMIIFNTAKTETTESQVALWGKKRRFWD